MEQFYGHVPASPTAPGLGARRQRRFDAADLYRDEEPGAEGPSGLDEKARKAYYWMANEAVINPFYDVEFEEGAGNGILLGDAKARLELPEGASFSSFILIPLLSLVLRRKCLLVGGPGRGKTQSALLMGLISGYPLRDVKRAIQHGQPQMTVADLLGSPLPSDIMKAESLAGIKIAWKSWLGMRVKIVDEYNRIPTRTQSALLTIMSDDYAEMMDQVYECPESAWYLTANDDAGGGTYEVIEALRDRIDVTVRALHFNTRFVGRLLARVEAGVKPEEAVPPEIVFTEEEIGRARREALSVSVPRPVLRRLEHFASQFEFLEPGAMRFEYRTKDSAKVSGGDPDSLAGQETGKDKVRDLGLQTRNGLSVRALMTCLVYIKAAAWFRGRAEAGLADARAVLPFVLHDKLVQNPNAPWFERPESRAFRVDRVSWVRELFDQSCAEYDRLGLDGKDPVGERLARFERGLEGVPMAEAEAEIAAVERLLGELASGRKLAGPLFDDVLALKYLRARWKAYAAWLSWRG